MPHKHCPPLPRLPAEWKQTKNRREFRAWLLFMLAEGGIELPPDPSYKQIQAVLEPLLVAYIARDVP